MTLTSILSGKITFLVISLGLFNLMRRYSKRRRDPPSSKPPERQDLDQRLNTLLQDCMDSFQTGDPFELSSDTIGAPEPP